MRLAWFSPLPPMASGIADYSYDLLPLLAERADVTVFCPKPSRFRRPKAPPGIRVMPPEGYDPAAFDATYFHLGNNPFHEFVYDAALEHGGLFVFHDLSLHHLLAYLYVERGFGERRRDRYEELFAEELGEEGRRVAALKSHGVASDLEKFIFPLTAHMAQRARGVVVHSRWAAERIGEQAPDVPLTVIPHHMQPAPPEVADLTRADARRRLGLPRDAFLVGHFGFVTRPKQPDAVVGGLAALRRERPDATLIVVGADNTGGGFDRIVDRHGVRGAVKPVGYVDIPKMYLYIKAVDAVINLRYPSVGESSGTMTRAMGEGRAVIVNDYHAFHDIPDDVALKVEIDRPQAEQVGAHLLRLATDPAFKARIEEAARTYAATVHDRLRCRDAYLGFAEGLLPAAAGGTALSG